MNTSGINICHPHSRIPNCWARETCQPLLAYWRFARANLIIACTTELSWQESSQDEDEGTGSKPALGNWKPQIHFVWDVILDRLLSSKSTNASKASFQEFFRVVVDGPSHHALASAVNANTLPLESLFSFTSSPERKYWGFQIFQKALPRVTAVEMPMLFTTNFMRSWINHLSNKDRYLHKAAKQVVRMTMLLFASGMTRQLIPFSGQRYRVICSKKSSFRVHAHPATHRI